MPYLACNNVCRWPAPACEDRRAATPRSPPGSACHYAGEVAEARTFFPLEKFFIFGHARSGTTMLTRLIRLHPEVHCNYQAHFFTRPPLLESAGSRRAR